MPPNNAKSKAKKLAEELDRQRGIYVFQAALDGLNISYTTLKYFFDALNPDATISSSNTMSSWMLTPQGIVAAAVESVFLIAFSMLANHLKETNEYQFCWMTPDIGFGKNRIKKNKLYVQISDDGSLRYTVKDPSGIDLSAVISPEELGPHLKLTKDSTLKQLQAHSARILDIILKRNHIKKPEPILFNKYLIQIWPYFRDSLKGLKNSYKGMSSVLTAFNLLGELGVHDLNLLIVPFAVALGGVTILNRIWYRRMKNQRKEKQEENLRLQKEIMSKNTLTEIEAAEFRSRVQHAQNQKERTKAFGSAVLAGFTDGLYLYMGVFTLASITGPLFVAICVLSAVYVLTSVATRIYEERDYQNKLKASQLKVELALAMQLLKTQLGELDELLALPTVSTEKEAELRANIAKNWDQLSQTRQQLKSLSAVFNTSALLGGLKNGLTAYGVLASILFAVGTILLLASVAFPPALLMTVVFLGVALLIGFTIHSLVENHRYRREQRELCKKADDLLASTKEKVDSLKITPDDTLDRLKQRGLLQSVLETVEDKDKQLVVKSTPQYSFEVRLGQWLEVCRAFFTGVKQASKSVNFAIGTFCQDTLVILIVTAVGGLVSALSGALRALAKGFGRSDNDVSDHSAPVLPPTASSSPALSSSPPSSPTPDGLVHQDISALAATEIASSIELPREESPTVRVAVSEPLVLSEECVVEIIVPDSASVSSDKVPSRATSPRFPALLSSPPSSPAPDGLVHQDISALDSSDLSEAPLPPLLKPRVLRPSPFFKFDGKPATEIASTSELPRAVSPTVGVAVSEPLVLSEERVVEIRVPDSVSVSSDKVPSRATSPRLKLSVSGLSIFKAVDVKTDAESAKVDLKPKTASIYPNLVVEFPAYFDGNFSHN